MLEFALAVTLMLSTPGPGVLSTAGVGAAFGARAGVAYVTGLFLGSNLVMLAVISGLAALLLAVPAVRMVLLVASTGYLFYMAARIALAGSKVAFIQAQAQPGIRAAVLLQIINPKAYVVGMTFFSGFVIWSDAYWSEVVIKLIVLNAIWIPIHIAWLYAGVALERLNLPARTQRAINIAMALAMLGVVGLALFSTQ
ncbi:Transporter, LysE family [Candidatus Rhodobacter oscarellae]|uniref:Transporter, LysE family n=1 Tax=Candidatus Rhodobacter oscarellae TaxID=1675527 RepID=A0A0J9ECB2_9RHOB|nr:LysE family transporter [Candidatus Rhodobacter lobularis]KMW60412.1 Transporter, LysE family [Candidatus Rhodobacter lobularis]